MGSAIYRLAFLRRGPVTRDVSDLDQVLPAFGRALRKAGVCSMVVNPRWSGDLADEAVHRLSALGAVTLPRGAQSIHRATLLVDLSGGPSDLAARLKSRCRRQISKCEKMGLEVRPAASLDEAMEFSPVLQDFHRRRRLAMTNVPSVAQQWEMTRDRGVMLLGRHEGRVICGHSVIVEGDRAFWLSLASTDEPQDMPRNYSLIWAALLHAQAQGLRWYDMAGGPSRNDAPKQETKGLMQDPGRIGRQQFKVAFDPVASELVPMMVIPLVRPVHAVLFSARQRYRAIAGGGWRFAT
ncbi:MAG: GNAT family N-acetyltransferase [Paracoccaceae bacterium]